jgi:hypothetical protein
MLDEAFYLGVGEWGSMVRVRWSMQRWKDVYRNVELSELTAG